jgi:hypothetical protein
MNSRRLLCAAASAAVTALAAAAPASAAPLNDDFADAKSLGTVASASSAFSLVGATQEPGEPAHFPDKGAGHTVWFKWTAPKSGGVRVHLCNAGASDVQVYEGSSFALLEAPPWSVNGADFGCPEQDHFMAEAGTTYRIVIDHSKFYSAGGGTLTLKQRAESPVATFPGWPATSPKTFKSPLRTKTWVDGYDEKLTTFTCTLNGTPIFCNWEGANLKNLSHGTHTFTAKVTDSFGNVGTTVSTKTWNVDAKGPVVSMPWSGVRTFTEPPLITWSADEPNVTYQCSLNYGEYVPCSSPWQAPSLDPGAHTLIVIGKDAYGNFTADKPNVQWQVKAPPAPKPPVQPVAPPVQPVAPPVQPPVPVQPATAPAPPYGKVDTAACRVDVRRSAFFEQRKMRVQLRGLTKRCVVKLTMKTRRRSLATATRTVSPGQSMTLVLKARRKVARGTDVSLAVQSR